MAEYNIVKHCRWCRKRYVVSNKESMKNYCDECQSKSIYKEGKNERNS